MRGPTDSQKAVTPCAHRKWQHLYAVTPLHDPLSSPRGRGSAERPSTEDYSSRESQCIQTSKSCLELNLVFLVVLGWL